MDTPVCGGELWSRELCWVLLQNNNKDTTLKAVHRNRAKQLIRPPSVHSLSTEQGGAVGAVEASWPRTKVHVPPDERMYTDVSTKISEGADECNEGIEEGKAETGGCRKRKSGSSELLKVGARVRFTGSHVHIVSPCLLMYEHLVILLCQIKYRTI